MSTRDTWEAICIYFCKWPLCRFALRKYLKWLIHTGIGHVWTIDTREGGATHSTFIDQKCSQKANSSCFKRQPDDTGDIFLSHASTMFFFNTIQHNANVYVPWPRYDKLRHRCRCQLAAAKTPDKYQSNWKSITTDLAPRLRDCDILR